jgi:hypothetical protein
MHRHAHAGHAGALHPHHTPIP